MNITKMDLANTICNKLKLTKHDALQLVDLLFEEIRLALENGQEVKLSGFGNFKIRNKTARIGRNPKTGKEAMIDPRRVVTFRSGLKLRALLAESTEKLLKNGWQEGSNIEL